MNGETVYRSAVNTATAERLFGAAGAALADVTQFLCESLAAHWNSGAESEWIPPFRHAHLSNVSPFSAANAEAALSHALSMHSTLHQLFAEAQAEAAPRQRSLVEQVKQHIRRSVRTKHLSQRFGRYLTLGDRAAPLRVDFLGRQAVCYFLQVTQSDRMLDTNLTQAYGKLFELAALRRFVSNQPTTLGLLANERPRHFELILVGDPQNPVRRSALAQIEAIADNQKVLSRTIPTAAAAAERVVQLERLAA